MPYISKLARTRPNALIPPVIQTIMLGTEAKLQKGEYFGFFVTRLIMSFMTATDYHGHSFNSALFVEPKRNALALHADKLSGMLNRDDALDGAGSLNYIISATYWGCLGASSEVETANYGLRAYFDGILEEIRDSLKNAVFPNKDAKSRVLSFRRYLVVKGVLNHLLQEVYRRQHTSYEEQKMAENGDLWVNGRLVDEVSE